MTKVNTFVRSKRLTLSLKNTGNSDKNYNNDDDNEIIKLVTTIDTSLIQHLSTGDSREVQAKCPAMFSLCS